MKISELLKDLAKALYDYGDRDVFVQVFGVPNSPPGGYTYLSDIRVVLDPETEEDLHVVVDLNE